MGRGGIHSVLSLELTCNLQSARAVGLAPVVLCKAGVHAFVGPRHVENLQTSILPDEHPEERPECNLHTLTRKSCAVWNIQRNTKVKSPACVFPCVCRWWKMMKVLWMFASFLTKLCELGTIQQVLDINYAKGKATMFDSFFSAYFIFMHEK